MLHLPLVVHDIAKLYFGAAVVMIARTTYDDRILNVRLVRPLLAIALENTRKQFPRSDGEFFPGKIVDKPGAGRYSTHEK